MEPLGGGFADEGGDRDVAGCGCGVQFGGVRGSADGDGAGLSLGGVGGGPSAGAHGGKVVGVELPGVGEVVAGVGFLAAPSLYLPSSVCAGGASFVASAHGTGAGVARVVVDGEGLGPLALFDEGDAHQRQRSRRQQRGEDALQRAGANCTPVTGARPSTAEAAAKPTGPIRSFAYALTGR